MFISNRIKEIKRLYFNKPKLYNPCRAHKDLFLTYIFIRSVRLQFLNYYNIFL